MANTTAEILWQLDRFAEHWGVPALDDGALYPVDCRLTCYADKVHWAMVLEVLEFAPNGTGHGGIVTNVFSFGNCIRVQRPPGMMQLDEWYHPKLSEGELPSQTETFQMVAEVLVTGELSRYRPTKLPNTHWSNWPKAGMFERPAGW